VSDGSERRRSNRIPISLAVRFQIGDGTVGSGVVENLSSDGLLLVATEPLEASVDLRMIFEDSQSGQALEISGRVVRSAAAGAFGVAFVSLTPEAHGFVERLIQRETGATAS